MVASKTSMALANVSNSSLVSTYGAAGFSILPDFLGCGVSHKCLLMPLRCKSRLTFTVSFSPVTVFKIFLANSAHSALRPGCNV